jgi:hypothetical protein
MVKCKICNFEDKDIEKHIINEHNISEDAYKKQFKGCKTKDFFYKRICKTCNKKWINTQNQGGFCSKTCRNLYSKNNEMNNKEGVICKICNVKREDITKHIVKIHKITTKEYLEKYPNSELMLENLKISRTKGYRKYNESNHSSWNKNLTKENNEKLNLISKNIKIPYKAWKIEYVLFLCKLLKILIAIIYRFPKNAYIIANKKNGLETPKKFESPTEKKTNINKNILESVIAKKHEIDIISDCLTLSSEDSALYFIKAVLMPKFIGSDKNEATDKIRAYLPYSLGPKNLPAMI